MRAQANIALDHEIALSADQDQMLNIVSANENEPAGAVDCGGVHHRKPCLAAAPAHHEGAEIHASHELDDDKDNDEEDQRRKCPENR